MRFCKKASGGWYLDISIDRLDNLQNTYCFEKVFLSHMSYKFSCSIKHCSKVPMPVYAIIGIVVLLFWLLHHSSTYFMISFNRFTVSSSPVLGSLKYISARITSNWGPTTPLIWSGSNARYINSWLFDSSLLNSSMAFLNSW